MAERILAALGEPYVLPGYLHHSTCSIGVTLFGGSDRTVSELLKQADLAMYQAKSAGRNTVCFFDPEMQAVVTANAALAADLRQAWRENQFLRRLPAAGRRRRPHDRRRGAAALEASAARHRAARPVHPRGRGDLADHPDRPLGAGGGLRAAGRSGRSGPTAAISASP